MRHHGRHPAPARRIMTHSLDLFHATAAVRAFVHRKALEDLFGAPGDGRVARPIEWESERARGTSRYRRPVDLRVPAPRMQRPQTSGGRTTTHVSIEVVRKVATPTTKGNKGGLRDDATAYCNYVTDPAKVGNIAYLTQPKSEAEPGNGEHRVAAFVSNISNDPATLEAYWKRRWEAGRDTGVSRLEFFPKRGTAEDWQALADAGDTPPRVARTAARIALLRAAGRSPNRHVVPHLEGDVLPWSEGLGERFGKKKGDRILHFAKPRSACIQIKIVFEFDDRLAAAERLRVLQHLMIWLDAQGVRMLAIAHEPDANNDPRNFHPHVLIDPTIYPVEGGRTVEGRGRKMRPGELAGILGHLPEDPPKAFWKLGALDHQAVRRFVVGLGNEQLAKRGLGPRFHAGSFAELGIDKTPNTHLGSTAAALVAAGALVERDYHNALNDWRFAIKQRGAELAGQESEWSRFRDDAREGGDSLGDDQRAELEEQLERHRSVAAASAEQLRQLAHFDTLVELARSASERLKSKTGRIIDNLDSGGKVTTADRKDQAHLRARHALAAMHLAEIEAAIAPYLPAIAAERTELAARLSELAGIERDVLDKREARRVFAAPPAQPKASVVAAPDHPDRAGPEARFAALVDHVVKQFGAATAASDRAVVHVFHDPKTGKLTANGLCPADVALVGDDRFAKRWIRVLEEAELRQRQAIRRLAAFVEANGQNRLILGFSWNGKALPSTLKRFRDGLDGHPVYASELSRANRRYETVGNNDQYLGLEKPDPMGASTPDPTAGVIVGPADSTQRNREPESVHVGVRMNPTTSDPTSAPIQINASSEVALSEAVASSQTRAQVSEGDADRLMGVVRPAATPADPIQPDNGLDSAIQQVDGARGQSAQRFGVRPAEQYSDSQISAATAHDFDTVGSPPLSTNSAAEGQPRDHLPALDTPAAPAWIAPNVAASQPAQDHQAEQAGMVTQGGGPDASAAAPDSLEAVASGVETPPITVAPAVPVSAGIAAQGQDGGKEVPPAVPKVTVDPLPKSDLTAPTRQAREAQRAETPTEVLRRGLLRSKRSSDGSMAKPPSPSPRSPAPVRKVASAQPSRTGRRPPDRAETVAAILSAHRRDGSEGRGGMTYAEFERRAAMFVNPIRDRALSIRIEAGKVQVGGIGSDDYLENLRRFAVDPQGWTLLVRLASALNDKVLPPDGAQWASVPKPSSVPHAAEGLLQRRGRGAAGLG